MAALTGPVLNSDQAAAYCGKRGGGQAMRDLKAKGKGPRWHKVGRVLVYYPADLDKWLSEQIEVAE